MSDDRTRKVHLRVRGKLDGAGGNHDGTLTIDPVTGMVTVRPHRKHSTYTVTLSEVADWICRRGMFGRGAA